MAFALKDYIADVGQGYNSNHRTEAWTVKLEVPWDAWIGSVKALMPVRGTIPPAAPDAFPEGYSVPAASVLLESFISFRDKDGDVVIHLVYGYSDAIMPVNTGYAITRTIMTEMPITHAWTAGGVRTLVNGVVTPAANVPISEEYRINVDDGSPTRQRMPFQLVRLIGLMDATNAELTAGELLPESGSVNTNEPALLGKTIVAGSMKYLGSSIDVYRYSSPGNLLYRGYFDWLVHPYLWPRHITRTKYTLKIAQFPVVDLAGAKIGEKTIIGRTAAAQEGIYYYNCKTVDFSTVMTKILTGA